MSGLSKIATLVARPQIRRFVPSSHQLARHLSVAAADGAVTSNRPNRRVARSPPKSARKRLSEHPRLVAREAKRIERIRRRPSPRARVSASDRPAPKYVLPALGLTASQLGALATGPANDTPSTAVRSSDVELAREIVRCARELEPDAVHDEATVLSAALVELVVEELRLNVQFLQQTPPLLQDDFPLTLDEDGGKAEKEQQQPSAQLETRPPVITVMGHVDHGKTSLLDALRNTDVAKGEAGGITQSVAAFRVSVSDTSAATFIDTPGHAAFSDMRANGTLATDIVVLVVAADDGVKPQTMEAAELARAADVPMIVAINKMDRPGADADRVRFQLLQDLNINTEQLGGDVQCVELSAKTGTGIDSLLEAIGLQAELLDMQCDPKTPAGGVCLESRADRALGSVASVVVRTGTLRRGDFMVFQNANALSGELYGRVRMLLTSDGKRVQSAGPGDAVGIVGMREPIPPGAQIGAVKDEKSARAKSQEMIGHNLRAMETIQLADATMREHAEKREKAAAEAAAAGGVGIATQGKGNQTDESKQEEEAAAMGTAAKKMLLVVVKGDVRGSADAVAQCVRRMATDRVGVKILSTGVGEVNESDMRMMSTAVSKKAATKGNAMMIAFNVRTKESLTRAARREGIQVLSHSIIYHLEDELREFVEKLQKMDEKVEKVVGSAAVLRVFEDGSIAGSRIDNGVVRVGDRVHVQRFPDDLEENRARINVFTGEVSSIKQLAKSVRSVERGEECGIAVADWSDFRSGDTIVSVKEE